MRAGLGPDKAADLFWALSSPHLYRMLVVECGWSPSDYRDWLAARLRDELLAPT